VKRKVVGEMDEMNEMEGQKSVGPSITATGILGMSPPLTSSEDCRYGPTQ
jgi:hypothetical protein